MKREFLFATVFAAACAVGASAQSGTGQVGTAGQSGTMQQSQPSMSAEKQAKDVTLTGCVQSGDKASSTAPGSDTMGTSGSSSAKANQFVLTNVTGAPATLSAEDRVALSGKDNDLEKHVGHKVEISGKWEASSASSYSSTGTAGTSGSTSPSGTLKVSSVKMIAESCSSH